MNHDRKGLETVIAYQARKIQANGGINNIWDCCTAPHSLCFKAKIAFNSAQEKYVWAVKEANILDFSTYHFRADARKYMSN